MTSSLTQLAAGTGMTVVAEAAIGEIPLLQWLARPVRGILDGAFAER